jgi:hypothetical protein
LAYKNFGNQVLLNYEGMKGWRLGEKNRIFLAHSLRQKRAYYSKYTEKSTEAALNKGS